MCQAAPGCQLFPLLQDRQDPSPHRIHHLSSKDTPRWDQTAANNNTSCPPAPTHLRFSMGPPCLQVLVASGHFPRWTSPFLLSLLGPVREPSSSPPSHVEGSPFPFPLDILTCLTLSQYRGPFLTFLCLLSMGGLSVCGLVLLSHLFQLLSPIHSPA